MEPLPPVASTMWDEYDIINSLSEGYEIEDIHAPPFAPMEDDTFHARLSYMSIFNRKSSERFDGLDKATSKFDLQIEDGAEFGTDIERRSKLELARESKRQKLIQTVLNKCQTYVELESINQTLISTVSENSTGPEFFSQVTNQRLGSYIQKLFRWNDCRDIKSEYPSRIQSMENVLKSHLEELREEYNELGKRLTSTLWNQNCNTLSCRPQKRQLFIAQLTTSCVNQGVLGATLAASKVLFNSLYSELTKPSEEERQLTKLFPHLLNPYGYQRLTVETSLRLDKYRELKETCVVNKIEEAEKKCRNDEIKQVKEKIAKLQRKYVQVDKLLNSMKEYHLESALYSKLKHSFDDELKETEEMICHLLEE